MRRLLLQSFFELRLLFKMRWPLLLPPAAGGWMLIQCLDPGISKVIDLNMFASEVHTQLMIFLTAVPVLLGVLIVRRDIFNPVYEWSLGLPVSNRILVSSKWIAGYLYCFLFIVTVQTSYLFAAYKHGLPWQSAAEHALIFTFLYAMSFGVSLSLGMILGALMPMRFALPIAFCGWIFGSIFVPLFLASIADLYPLNAFSLNHLANSSSSPSYGAWGMQLEKTEHRLLLAINVAFGLFMLTATAALLARVRPVRRPKMPLLVMWTALLIAIASLVPYGGLWADRYERASAAKVFEPGLFDELQEPYKFRIDRMALDVVRQPDEQLLFQATIELPTMKGKPVPAAPNVEAVREHKEGELTFLLYPQLKVSQITADGKKIKWRQEQERVSLKLDQLAPNKDTHIIEINYQGRLYEWALRHNSNFYYRGFVDHKNVYLPASLGWYPIAGGADLFVESGASVFNREDVQNFMTAEFDLTMSGFPGELYASIPPAKDDRPERRHWHQTESSRLMVIGGQFETVKIDGEPVFVVTTPGSTQLSKYFLESLKERRSFYENWLDTPLHKIRQIIFLPLSHTMDSVAANNISVSGDTLIVNHYTYNSISNNLQSIMKVLLFGDLVDEMRQVDVWDEEQSGQLEKYSIVQELRQLISSYVWNKRNREPAESWTLSPVHEKMLNMVEDAYNNGEEDLVRRVLLHFYRQGLTITDLNRYRLHLPESAANDIYLYPTITWKDWLTVWNEEKGR